MIINILIHIILGFLYIFHIDTLLHNLLFFHIAICGEQFP